MSQNKIELGIQYREFEIKEKINEENRTVELTFSSETPYERYWGIEILDHSSKSVIMDRIGTKSAPLLLDHDRTQQIGIVEQASIGGDKKGHAAVRFSKSAKAEEIFQDVKDEIRTLVSVGYRIHEVKLEESKDNIDTYRVTKWEPLEISIVSIPADIGVGIGRENADDKNEVLIENVKNRKVEKMENEEKKITTPAVDTEKIETDTRNKELNRIDEIYAIGKRFGIEEEATKAVKERMSVDAFRAIALEKLEAKKHIDTKEGSLGLSENEKKQYSLQRAIIAAITQDWGKAGFEREMSLEVAKIQKREPKGFYVPHDILFQKRELTASGSNLVGTDHLAGSFIELLRNNTKVVELGALVLSGLTGNVSIPKQTGAATGYWVAESGDVTASDPTFSALTLAPKTVGARTLYSRNMLLQSNPSIENLVMNDLTKVIALAIDLGALHGTGANNQPTGVALTSGIGAVSGSSFDWAAAVEFETDVAAANADVGSMAYLTNATVRGILKTREKATNTARFLMEGAEMNGYPVHVSNQVSAGDMFFGVWSQLIIGLWSGLDILVNPYTNAADGGVYIHAFQTCDIGVRQATAFSYSSDID